MDGGFDRGKLLLLVYRMWVVGVGGEPKASIKCPCLVFAVALVWRDACALGVARDLTYTE
jgi:hypothetical protein